MSARIGCVVVATEKRFDLVQTVVTSATRECDEVVVVGDWRGDLAPPFTYHYVEPFTRTPIDALVKRDVGTLALPDCDILVYLCDDHVLAPGFGDAVRAVADESWDVIVPNRYTWRMTEKLMGDPPFMAQYPNRIDLNNGEHAGYCGGHAGVFRRDLIARFPWSTGPHHPWWDVDISRAHIAAGAHYVFKPRADIAVEDIEPNATPWK